MLVIDVSEHEKTIEKLIKKIGKDNFKIEQIGTFDCGDKLFPIKNNFCVNRVDFETLNEVSIKYDKTLCESCKKRRYIRFADFTNDTHSFYYERKTVFDFISSRKRRLYDQMTKMDIFIEGRKGLILEGMGEHVAVYDAYWKNINKKLLQTLSPIQQAIELGGNPEWVWSFVRELKHREMEFVQTWNFDETIDFLLQCDEGYDKVPKLRLIPKRYPEFPIERNILALFDGIGKVRSGKILEKNPLIKEHIETLIRYVEDLKYGKNKN